MPAQQLAQRVADFTGRTLDQVEDAVKVSQEKMQTLTDFEKLCGWLYRDVYDYDEKAWRKTMKDGSSERLEQSRAALAVLDPWDEATIQEALDGVVERLDAKPGQIFQPIRVALTGNTVSPGIYESVALLGKEETLSRIDRALAHARENGGESAA